MHSADDWFGRLRRCPVNALQSSGGAMQSKQIFQSISAFSAFETRQPHANLADRHSTTDSQTRPSRYTPHQWTRTDWLSRGESRASVPRPRHLAVARTTTCCWRRGRRRPDPLIAVSRRVKSIGNDNIGWTKCIFINFNWIKVYDRWIWVEFWGFEQVHPLDGVDMFCDVLHCPLESIERRMQNRLFHQLCVWLFPVHVTALAISENFIDLRRLKQRVPKVTDRLISSMPLLLRVGIPWIWTSNVISQLVGSHAVARCVPEWMECRNWVDKNGHGRVDRLPKEFIRQQKKIGFTASSTTMMMKKSMNSCIVQFAWNSA